MSMLGELLAPLTCVACGAPSDGDLCRSCGLELQPITGPVCARCGSPAVGPVPSCSACHRLKGFSRARSLVAYRGPASRLVVALKHRGRPGLAAQCGRLLADLARREGLARGVAAVTFVPAGSTADRRGFDHAELLARSAARTLGRPVAPLVQRASEGLRQSEVPLDCRLQNARGRFKARDARGVVLLVDDVFTTGATAEACSLELLREGASAVNVLTFARTLRRLPRPRPR